MKNAFKNAFLICASLIGAGFASGKEVMEFFCSPRGLLFALFSVFLICLSVCFILKAKCSVFENSLYKVGTGLFLVCILSVMIAGTGEIMPYGRYVMSAAVFITVAFGLRGVENVSVLLCPAMILFIVLFGSECAVNNIPIKELPGSPAPFLYAGYNILSFPVLLKNSQAGPKLTAFITGLIMLPLIAVVYMASLSYPSAEMPFLKAAGGGVFTVFVLLSAMYTTAACSAFCLKDITGGKNLSLAGIIFIALLLSFTGFGMLISKGYRFFGFTGVVMIGYIVFDYVKYKICGDIARKQENNKVYTVKTQKIRD